MGETFFNVEYIEKGMLSDAKQHIGKRSQVLTEFLSVFPGVDEEDVDESSDFETLTEIQHYGGKTNLIDFTTDYLIALFFACDGKPRKDGRVILQKIKEITKVIEVPQNPRHRVIVQKSVFVRPPKGFIEPCEEDIVKIPANLKKTMLEHLRKYHNISTETIYNDLHGFIKTQSIHQKAYAECYIGLNFIEEKNYDRAIIHFNKAIERNPYFPVAYFSRGVAFYRKDCLRCACADFTYMIEKCPQFGIALSGRGLVYLRLKEWNNAKADLIDPRNRKEHIIQWFRAEHESVGVFEKRYGIQLPPDIARILTPDSPE
jgi:tetratricopeptide (TPR) repeat protein